jgi:Spy/CpxP family protein refolding chaperone
MSDTERVRAWRQRLKEHGLIAVTLWLRPETKARYEDLAQTQRRSLSELAQQALDAYRLDPAAVAATVPDTAPLRALIRDELDQTMAIMTATVTATVTETITEMLPAIVAAAVRGLVTATVSDTDTATVTETTAPPRPHQATPLGQHKLTARQAAALRAKRQRGVPIKALMEEYGLSKATVHRYLKTP